MRIGAPRLERQVFDSRISAASATDRVIVHPHGEGGRLGRPYALVQGKQYPPAITPAHVRTQELEAARRHRVIPNRGPRRRPVSRCGTPTPDHEHPPLTVAGEFIDW